MKHFEAPKSYCDVIIKALAKYAIEKFDNDPQAASDCKNIAIKLQSAVESSNIHNQNNAYANMLNVKLDATRDEIVLMKDALEWYAEHK